MPVSKPKGRWFDSQSGHVPGLPAGALVGGRMRDNPAMCLFYIDVSLTLSLLSHLSKMSKWNLFKNYVVLDHLLRQKWINREYTFMASHLLTPLNLECPACTEQALRKRWKPNAIGRLLSLFLQPVCLPEEPPSRMASCSVWRHSHSEAGTQTSWKLSLIINTVGCCHEQDLEGDSEHNMFSVNAC